MKGWLLAGVFGVLLLLAGYEWVDSLEDLSVAQARADSLAQANARLRIQQHSDSVTLETERRAYAAQMLQLEGERREASQNAARASRNAQEAGTALRYVLDSLGVSTALLDALEAAEAEEDRFQASQLAVAESTTAVVRSLLEVTEEALASERALRLGVEAEVVALGRKIDAQNAARRRERLVGALVLGVVLLR